MRCCGGRRRGGRLACSNRAHEQQFLDQGRSLHLHPSHRQSSQVTPHLHHKSLTPQPPKSSCGTKFILLPKKKNQHTSTQAPRHIYIYPPHCPPLPHLVTSYSCPRRGPSPIKSYSHPFPIPGARGALRSRQEIAVCLFFFLFPSLSTWKICKDIAPSSF